MANSDWAGRVTRGLERQSSFAGGLISGGAGAAAPAEELILNGEVTQKAVWNEALTEAEIDALAAGVSPLAVRPEALVSYEPEWIEGRGPSAHGAIGTTSRGHCRDYQQARTFYKGYCEECLLKLQGAG